MTMPYGVAECRTNLRSLRVCLRGDQLSIVCSSLYMTTTRGALRYVVYYRVDESRCFWFVLSGDSGRRVGASLARIEWALGRGEKTTYGRSSKKPTVDRSTDLPWVAKTTYRRSFLGGARRLCLDGLESGFEDRACIPSKGSDFLGGGKA